MRARGTPEKIAGGVASSSSASVPATSVAIDLDRRAAELFAERSQAIARRADRMFALLIAAQWLCAIAFAALVSPYAWAGPYRSIHVHIYAAVLLGGAITAAPVALALTRPGWFGTRMVVATAQMMWSALLIHLTGGRIETHFHVFGSLAFLAFYGDWRVLVPASIVVVVDHFLRGLFWPESVYGVASAEWWRFLEHGFWVAFCDLFLILACRQAMRDLRAASRQTAESEELSRRLAAQSAELEMRVDERTTELTASLKQLEQANSKLVLADRLAALGQLSAAIGHEINNPLAYVLTNLEIVSEMHDRPGERELVAEALGDALQGAERITKIVKNLKVFARADEDRREPVDVVKVAELACKMAMNEIRHRGRLVLDLQPVPDVLADESRLTQVFLNLLINAAHACQGKREGGHEVRVTTRAVDGGVVIEVEDTGVGMSDKVQARLFEPFFTTKGAGMGTGLGLSICHDIVTGLGGTISATSEPGAGSRFRLVLPATVQGTAADRPTPDVPAPRGPRRLCALLVDDEPLVLTALERALGPTYEVARAGSGREALERLGSAAHFDVVLCDLMMPEMTGMDLHRRVRELQPASAERFIFMTGGAFTPEARTFLDETEAPFIEKPFRAASVLALVGEFCAGHRQPHPQRDAAAEAPAS